MTKASRYAGIREDNIEPIKEAAGADYPVLFNEKLIIELDSKSLEGNEELVQALIDAGCATSLKVSPTTEYNRRWIMSDEFQDSYSGLVRHAAATIKVK